MISKFEELDDIGKYVEEKYNSIRFLFEIYYTKDDYLKIKVLFQRKEQLKSSFFEEDFLTNYFRRYPFQRLPFLLLIVGFIRYEYLDDNNSSSFFANFLKNILENSNAKDSDFRKEIINCFFKFKGVSKSKESGLYIFPKQLDCSLKLSNLGKNKYIDSFLFHSGCVCDNDDLKIFLRVIKELSEKIENNFDFMLEEILGFYKNLSFENYNNNIKKFFEILENSDLEISSYYFEFLKQSIYLLKQQEYKEKLELPLYIRNYILFSGIYENISKINFLETDFIYQNESIVFKPNYKYIYNQLENISFKFGEIQKDIKKSYDKYTEEDFDEFYLVIEEPNRLIKFEMYIDNILFKRYEINLFKNSFLLIDDDFNIKSLNNKKEIEISQNDENKNYYIITNEELELKKAKNNHLKGFYFYELPLNKDISYIEINDIKYEIIYQAKFDIEPEYKDDKFLYFSKIPKFILSQKDELSFEAKNLFTNEILNHQNYILYDKVIGKFEIKIRTKQYNIVVINGFEIIQWFNWYDENKIIKILLEDKNVKVNNTSENILYGKRVLEFVIKKLTNPILIFNQINGENIHIELKEPQIELSLIDKKRNELKINNKNKNIRIERLKDFKRLKITLENFPTKIFFDKAKIFKNELDLNRSFNEYFLSTKEILSNFNEINKSNASVQLYNKYSYLNVANIINNQKIDKTEEDKDFIRIYDIEFLKSNYKNIKVYFDNKPYNISEISEEIVSGFTDTYVVMEEVRKTKKENIRRRPFKQIEKNGLYLDLGDIIYE